MGTEDEEVGSRRVVEKLRVGYTFRSLLTTEVNRLVEMEYETAVHRLESFVLAEKLAEDEYTDHVTLLLPASVWQHFKSKHAQAWWMLWFVKHRPVEWTEIRHELVVKVKRYATYPEADVELPGLGRPVIWEQVETALRSDDGE